MTIAYSMMIFSLGACAGFVLLAMFSANKDKDDWR